MRPSHALSLGAGLALLLAAGALGCSLSSSDYAAAPQLAGDAKLTILQTTDLHHHANGVDHVGMDANPSAEGSYARIAAYVNFVRASAGRPVVLVDSGDWSMGTLYDLTLAQQPMALYFLDAMKYNCVTLGNHEFDYTPAGLAKMLAAANATFTFSTPIVASNIDLKGNADLAPYVGPGKQVQPTRVETLSNGLKVGYIGLMGTDAAASAPTSAPVTFPDFSAKYGDIQALVDGLRNQDGCHVVVALSHCGTDAAGTAGEDVELARHVKGIDVIASGHSHNPLSSARTVANGTWNTKIICAGAYGTNVSRIDLTYNAATKSTSVDASSNPAMTDAGLRAINPALRPDPAFSFIVGTNDQQLNAGLGDLFRQLFTDYNPADLGKGIYHPVGVAAQEMVSNEKNPVLCPNGLGNLSADAVRTLPNLIIGQALASSAGNPAALPPGYDTTFFQAGVVASGVIRGKLKPGVPLSFADVYNVHPLGISPDLSQPLPVGYPLVSAYLDPADFKKVCALQLVAQTNLAPSQYYLNLSGIRYGLKAQESYAYFKFASAAAILQVTSQKAAAGSTKAQQAMAALATLGSDSGAALLAAYASGNAYAAAMVSLNDTNPTQGQIAANLATLGQVAVAASAGSSTLSSLVVSKAVAAIDTLAGFSPFDGACKGATSNLSGTARIRVAADLYAILMLGAAQAQFGVAITPYKAATGATTLSSADFPGLLANRVDQSPTTPGVQEVKEWTALLMYTSLSLGGTISADYASTPLFTQFGSFGPAVQVRQASYPIASIGQLMGTLGALQAAP
jgi:5'-nucleotidase